MPTLSLCMIVRNEEANIARCLKSVQPALDEIIIVDTGSTDRTPDIAKQFGAKVYFFNWTNDFSAARNEALKYATGDYIIWLDADECLKKQDLEKLIQLKAELPEEKNIAYAVKILNFHKQGFPDAAYQTRIFPHISGVKFEGKVHEQVSFSLQKLGVKFQVTDLSISHLGYLTKDLWQTKIKRNLSFLQEILSEAESSTKWTIHFYLGMCYLNLGEEDLAHIHFAQALTPACKEENPYFYITAGVYSAKILEKTGEPTQGIQLLLKLKDQFPEDDFILYHLGEAYFQMKDYQQAFQILSRCRPERINLGIIPISIQEYKFKYHYYLGLIYENLGETLTAISMYKKALEIKPYALELLAHLSSLLLFKINQSEKAIFYLIKGIEFLEKKGKVEVNREIYIALCLMLAFVLSQKCRIEECVFLAERLLKIMHLPANRVLNSLEDLIDIFQEIGEGLQNTDSIWAPLAFETASQLKSLLPDDSYK